jgi:hypothetical protein
VVALGIAALGLNAGLLASGGVRHGGDTARYLAWAEALRAGRPLGGWAGAYGGYVSVIALMHGIGLGLPGVVGLQLAVAAVAGVVLAWLGAALGGPLAGLAAAAVLLVNPDVARWHAYVLTDSLYTSVVVLAAWGVWRAAERGGAWYLAGLALLGPAAVLRPTGLVLLPVAFACWGLRGVARRDWLGVGLGVVGLVMAIGVALSPRVQHTIGQVPSYTLRSGRVIYQHPAFRVAMPVDPTGPGAGWGADLAYVARHPGPVLRLAARRVLVELAHVRPYYRPHHNALIVATLLPLYALAAVGIGATWRHPLTRLLVALVAAHLGLVAATLADYDGRFLVHVLGPLGALAGAGLARIADGRARGAGPHAVPGESAARSALP